MHLFLTIGSTLLMIMGGFGATSIPTHPTTPHHHTAHQPVSHTTCTDDLCVPTTTCQVHCFVASLTNIDTGSLPSLLFGLLAILGTFFLLVLPPPLRIALHSHQGHLDPRRILTIQKRE